MEHVTTKSDIIDQLEGDFASLKASIENTRSVLFSPETVKTLRNFSAAEVAKYIGITPRYLSMMADDLNMETEKNGRGVRSFSLEQVRQIRDALADKVGVDSKKGIDYSPHRREGEALQVIAVANFKGGSAKTTTSAHLAQYLGLRGYRVLCIDIDAQASLSAMFGIHSEYEVGEDETLYGALQYDNTKKISEIIRPTYFTGVDIIPAGLELSNWEFDAPRNVSNARYAMMDIAQKKQTINQKLQSSGITNTELDQLSDELKQLESEEHVHKLNSAYFMRLAWSLQEVEDQYDVVIIDCPPNLGYLTNCAVFAASQLLVTIHPQWLDTASMQQFLTMAHEHLTLLEEHTRRNFGSEALINKKLSYLITRYEQHDTPQTNVVTLLRSQLANVMTAMMLKSTAITEAGTYQQTLYEAEKALFNRQTYERALEALNTVNGEIENLLKAAWGRDYE